MFEIFKSFGVFDWIAFIFFYLLSVLFIGVIVQSLIFLHRIFKDYYDDKKK